LSSMVPSTCGTPEGAPRASSPSKHRHGDARRYPQAPSLVERFRSAGFESQAEALNTYAAVQIWAHAVQEAGTTALRVSASLRSQAFETAFGRIGSYGKGDVTKPGSA
jgi:branched-chain amino acid transport system substrate-binding protein